MTRRFYYTMDGSSMEFGSPFRPPREQLEHLLGLLSPEKRSTFVLSQLPANADFLTYFHAGGNDAFLQCAGTSEAMTIEWRKRDDDGEYRIYTLGHGGPRHGAPDVTITFDHGAHELEVYPDEVFDKAEAADIFFTYYETATVPEKYVLRPYDLTETSTP